MRLQAEGIRVQTYANSETAFHGIIDDPVELSLLDIKMPRMDGMKMLSRLITNISDGSRLDVELARSRMRRMDIGRLLPILAEAHESADRDGPRTRVAVVEDDAAGIPPGSPDLIFEHFYSGRPPRDTVPTLV